MSSALDISVDPWSGSIALRGTLFERAACWETIKGLLERVLAVDEIDSIKVDRRLGIAQLEVNRDRSTPFESSVGLVRKVAEALRNAVRGPDVSDVYRDVQSVRLSKVARDVVGGCVCSTAPGRTRLQHPLLRLTPSLGVIVRSQLEYLAGVHRVTISSATGTAVILHAPTVFAPDLLIAMERAIRRAGNVAGESVAATRLVLSGGCLGLAVVAEFFVPGLVPVTAGALVLCNLPKLCQGVGELVTFRWRLPALYTVIMGTTLVSGQVLAAAIMQASVVGWYWWSSHRLRRMMTEILSSPALARAARSEQNLAEFAPHIDANGSWLRNGGLHANKVIHASMPTAEGGTRWSYTEPASDPLHSNPVCDSLISSLAQLASDNQPTAKGHDQAAGFVPYTFCAGAAALITADITTLAAVLRPDFATGPSITERLSMVSSVRQLLESGWLVLQPDALLRLAAVDTVVVIGDASCQSNVVVETGSRDARRAFPVLAAVREQWELPHTETTLEVHRVNATPAVCLSYIQQLIDGGAKVAVSGPGHILEQLPPDTLVRIADEFDEFNPNCTSDIVGLSERCDLTELWDVLIHQIRCRHGIWPVVMTCNVASVAGAFLIGLTSLHVVALTNLGTLAAYAFFRDRSARCPSTGGAASGVGNEAYSVAMPLNHNVANERIVDSKVIGNSQSDSQVSRYIMPDSPVSNRIEAETDVSAY